MAFESDDYLARPFRAGGIDLGSKIEELTDLVVPQGSPNRELYQNMLTTVVRMAQADRNRWDAKIMAQTLRELERSFSVLDRFKRRRKVTVFGSARTPVDHPLYAMAVQLGELLAKRDLMVITGAGGGIMAAAHEGAGLENSIGLNITLPFEQHANATVDGTDNLLSFHFFFTRKLFFVKEADALVLCPGGFGTLDEALEVLTLIQTGKSPLVPVILLDEPGGSYWQDAMTFMQRQLLGHRYILPSDMHLMRLVHSAEDAVAEIARFYGNYHSSRWLKGEYILRMNHPLNDATLGRLHEEYADLCLHGGFTQHPCCQTGEDDAELCDLPRLVFTFNARDHGRLRELVDLINDSASWA